MVEQNDDLEEKQILKEIESRLAGFSRERSSLIPILQMIQGQYHYLPKASLELVGRHLDIPPAEVFGVATFYNQFRFNPPGKHPIKVCLGTACHLKGGQRIVEELERRLDVEAGGTTADMRFTLNTVNCVGACALAPVVVVDEDYHANTTARKLEKHLNKLAHEFTADEEG